MHHVAIMNPSWKLIPKILSGEKQIESRWYQTRRAPWNRVQKGDVIFFKDSGKPVTVRALVSYVWQFEMSSIKEAQSIVNLYGDKICLIEKNVFRWKSSPRYCILMKLSHPQKLKKPFHISKRGFGSSTAWITIPHIDSIRI